MTTVYLPPAGDRPAEPARLLRPRDIAALMGIQVRKVWDWIHSGRLPAENLTPDGGRATWRVDPAEYRAFRDKLKTVPAATKRRRRRSAGGECVIEFIK